MLRFAGLGGPAAIYEEYTFPALTQAGLRQDTVLVRQWRDDGAAGDVVARLPGIWMDVRGTGGDGRFAEVRLAGSQMLAGGTQGAVFVHGDAFTVYWFGDGGRLAAITRVSVPKTRVTAQDRREEDRRYSDISERNRSIRVEPGQPPPVYATYRPEISAVAFDSEGRAWLRRWTGYSSRTADWIVLDAFGAPIARIRMPGSFLPNDLGPDYVLGLLTDEDGVQSIQRYRITR